MVTVVGRIHRRERARDYDIDCAGDHIDLVKDVVGDAEPTDRSEEDPEREGGPFGLEADSSGENLGPAVCKDNYPVVDACFGEFV